MIKRILTLISHILIRRIYLIILILCVYACSLNDDLDFFFLFFSKNHDAFLIEYHENNQLMQTFEYDDGQLFIQTLLRDDKVSSMQFIYSDNGMVDSAYIRQSWFARDLKFHYTDSLINESLLHCPQIGPARLAKLQTIGIRSWRAIR